VNAIICNPLPRMTRLLNNPRKWRPLNGFSTWLLPWLKMMWRRLSVQKNFATQPRNVC